MNQRERLRCLFYGMAARPVKYDEFIFMPKLTLTLDLYFLHLLSIFLLFDGARIVIRHRCMVKNLKTINVKRLTTRVAMPNNDQRYRT